MSPRNCTFATLRAPNVPVRGRLKNVPPLFSSFQQSIKYYHCSDIRNAYVNDLLPILCQRSTATAFDKLSYSYRTSIAKYFDLVVTIEIYIYWPNIVSVRRYCSSQQGKPLAGASARGLGGFGQDLRSIWQPNSRLGRRSACACAEADFWETSGTT